MRTRTGQTGKDAYVFELAAIANKRRALEDEWKSLLARIADDLPSDATSRAILTDDFTLPIDRDVMVSTLEFWTELSTLSIEEIQGMISRMA